MATAENEQRVWSQDRLLIGIDEAGLGCVAGSCYVGLVIFPRDYIFLGKMATINDSKKLTESKRNELAEIIKSESLYWACESVSASQIDKGSAYHLRYDLATKMAREAIVNYPVVEIIMDGNKEVPNIPNTENIENKFLIKGDLKSFTIAAASILAKTSKDAEMHATHLQYPEYSFDKNKGYASKEHIKAIEENGLSPVHRTTFCTKFKVNYKCERETSLWPGK